MTRYRHGPLEEAIAAANTWRRQPTPEPLDTLRARVLRESRAAADEALRTMAAQPCHLRELTSISESTQCGYNYRK